MKLQSIRLVHYRGIDDATVEFDDGVTIVEGPNEIGKSSIHEALSQLRNDKASSRRASVKETQPVGSDVGPQAEVHLSTGDFELKYSKRWIKQPFAELTVLQPTPEQHSGDEAHDRFLAILDETVDVDLLEALDVAQGSSLTQASLAEIRAVHSALSDSGAEPADHDVFLERVEEEFARFFTAKGKEKAELKALDNEADAAQETFAEVQARSDNMDELVENHARATGRLETVTGQLEAAVEERDAAEQASKAVAELKAVLDRLLERAASTGRDVTIAREALDRRQALIADVEAATRTVKSANEAAQDLDAVQAEKTEALETAKKAFEGRASVLEEARSAAKTASRDLARARARSQVAELRQRLTTIRSQEERRAEAQARISSIGVRPKDVESLRVLETEVRIAENAKTAAAAQIVARRLGAEEVRVDGASVGESGSEEFAVVKDVEISVDGIAEITVRPGVSPAELDSAVTASGEALEAELDRLEVDSLAQARERADARAAAEAVVTEATSTLTALLGDDDRSELDAALARAEHLAAESVAGNGESGAGEGSAGDGDRETETTDREVGASVDELTATVEAADRTSDMAQTDVDEARADVDRVRTAWDDARVSAVRAQAALQEATTGIERLAAKLETERSSVSDDALEETVTEAGTRLGAVEAEVVEARKDYEAADPGTLEMQLQNARRLVDSKGRQREADRQEVDRLSALIDDRAGEGIYEKLKVAEEAAEASRTQQARLRKQAAAIAMLRQTVLAHKEEAQRKYVAPFKEQIERLGRLIFGQGLRVEVSEDLQIVSRTLNNRTVRFDSLSGGTKEQLALIGRLAVATLVDEGSGAPVILDDAFGFADAERLSALNVILSNVGRSAQVILLTCQPDRFARLGGAKMVSLV